MTGKFKIREEVVLPIRGGVISSYYTESDDIPSHMIKHGSLAYQSPIGKIVGIHDKYYLAEYTDVHNQRVRLGYKEEDLGKIIKPEKRNNTLFNFDEL